MAFMRMPKLSESGGDAVVSEWMVAAGDVVRMDAPVVAMETDKIVVEVPSTVDGKVRRLLVAEGEVVRAGQPILEVD